MKFRITLFSFLWIIPLWIISCQTNSDPSADKTASDAQDLHWDQTASYLAGLGVPESSPYYSLVSTEEYRKHKEFMDSVWQRAESSSIRPIRSWYNGTPKAYRGTPVFYPLSGADFINMYLMYPDSKEYVMAAMEETGNVTIHPDPATALRNLNALRRAVHLYFVQNYFQTRIMNETFRENQNLRGVLPILLVFMKRMGLFIKNVETMPDADGAMISFSERPEGETRTLRYYQRKLENSFEPSVLGLKQYRLIMKSAVYLLQMHEYQTLANTIQNSSVMVIQDDSGLSYSRFRNDDWKVNLYGSYHRVRVKGTQYIYQKDLQADLASSGEPLPFQFGYGTLSGKDKSNLMIAIRSGKN